MIKKRGVAQLASAPALGAGGRGFKSLHPDQTKFNGVSIHLAKVTHKSARVLPGVCPLATCRIVLHAITNIKSGATRP